MSEKLTLEEENLAEKIYVALIGNPERYKYIAGLMNPGSNQEIRKGITQEKANEKNLNKAIKLAKYFYANTNLTREVVCPHQWEVDRTGASVKCKLCGLVQQT